MTLLCSLLLLCVQPTTQPSADQVIADFIDATGGPEAQRQVDSRRHVGTIEVIGTPLELTGTAELVMTTDQEMRLTSTFPSVGDFERVATADVGWSRDPFAGLQLLPEAEREQSVAELTPEALADPTTLYDTREYVGAEPVAEAGSAAAHRLRLTTPEGRVVEQWYDAETRFLVKQVDVLPTPLGDAALTAIFTDWRPVESADGAFTVTMPFAVDRIMENGVTVKLRFEEATVNGDLPADLFEVPAEVKEKSNARAAAPAEEFEPVQGL